MEKCVFKSNGGIVIIDAASVATDMPLIGSPWPSVFILGIYWVSVKHIGPTIMKHRDPVDVKNWIITYNIYQIMANAILCYCTIREMTRPDNNLFCLQVSRSSAMLCYLYFLNKLTDLTETFFFVLKKSWRQISYLHLYHHVAIVTCSYVDFYIQPGIIYDSSPQHTRAIWLFANSWTNTNPLKLSIGGLSMFMLLLNTFVHVVMYIYYLLSIWKPSLSMLPKFKRTVTQIQLVIIQSNTNNDPLQISIKFVSQFSELIAGSIRDCSACPVRHTVSGWSRQLCG